MTGKVNDATDGQEKKRRESQAGKKERLDAMGQ